MIIHRGQKQLQEMTAAHVGQLAAAATGAGVPLAPLDAPAAGAAAAAAAAARTVCSSVLFSATAREACWNYTAFFAQDP